MATHSSATTREATPHISNAVKRRAQLVIRDKSINAQIRGLIRYGLEINDPWLPELVRRVDAGECNFDNLDPGRTSER